MPTISPDAQSVISKAGPGALQFIQGQPGYSSVGGKLTSGEATRLLQGFTPKPTVGQQVQQGIAKLTSEQYQFDPQKFLPGIQQQAQAIYGPQQAQLEAIRQLNRETAAQTRVQTQEDFDKRLQQEVEAINRRGAYFSGGAVRSEQDIRTEQSRALRSLDLQAAAADYRNLAQQGILGAEEAQFIQERLYNAESSAYARWSNERTFSMNALLSQYQVYSSERNFARDVFESDRQYDLAVDQMEMKKREFEQTYDITRQQFEMAKKEFDIDLKTKNLSYESALTNFKKKYAVTNSGVLGTDGDGNDIADSHWDDYIGEHGGEPPRGAQSRPQNDGGVFNIDDFLLNQ